MQCASAMLSSVATPAVQYFSTLSHKRHDFREKKKVTEHELCVLIFCTAFFFSKDFLILKAIQRDIIINVLRYLCKVPVIFAKF